MHLLLDFDGVVLKKHPACKIVGYRCEKFVSKFFPNLDNEGIKRVNKRLYERHGHTLVGLRKIKNLNIDIDDFNKHVYKGLDYNNLFSDIKTSNKEDINNFKNIINYCKKNNVNMKIFSNAPSDWCTNIQYMMGVSPIEDLYNEVTSKFVKPNKDCYDNVESLLKDDMYFFVDDKEINLLPINDNKKWLPISMDKNTKEITTTVTDLSDLLNIIHINSSLREN